MVDVVDGRRINGTFIRLVVSIRSLASSYSIQLYPLCQNEVNLPASQVAKLSFMLLLSTATPPLTRLVDQQMEGMEK